MSVDGRTSTDLERQPCFYVLTPFHDNRGKPAFADVQYINSLSCPVLLFFLQLLRLSAWFVSNLFTSLSITPY